MDADQIVAIISIFCLALLNAFFMLAKTALVTVQHTRLTQMAEEKRHEATATAVQRLMRDPSRVFAAVQVGSTLALFGMAVIAVSVLGPALAGMLHRLGVLHDVRFADAILILLGAFLALTMGDLVPYSYARRHPERAAVLVAVPMQFFVSVLTPLASIALGIANLCSKPFGFTASFAHPVVTEEELRRLLEASAQSGAIEEEEKEIIRNVISFGDTDVRQVMTPRIDMAAADAGIGVPDLVALIVDSGHSRIPIYEGNVDTIVGIVHAKDLLPALARGEQAISLRQVARAPLFVPENKRVDDLLAEFRVANLPIAIVQDEYGGTAGLVTIEDLLEEIVGEIKDEYDIEEPMIRPIDKDTMLLDGRTPIADVNEALDLDVPDDDFDTIGGFVFGLFGHQPAEGDKIRSDEMEFTVTRTDGRRILEVRLDLKPQDANVTNADAEPSSVGG